jgi:hypothetical protein
MRRDPLLRCLNKFYLFPVGCIVMALDRFPRLFYFRPLLFFCGMPKGLVSL